MRIDTITLEDIKKYANLDPFGTLRRLVFPNYFAVCATEKVNGTDVPIGIAVAGEETDGVYIDWIFVRVHFRNNGVGEALLQKIFDVAVELEKSQVCFRLKKEAVAGGRTETIKEYLKKHLFSETGKKYSEYNVDLESFTDNPVIAVDRKRTLKAKPLGILKPAEIRKAIKTLMEEKTSMSLYDMDEYIPVFDAKFSSVLMFEDEACGLLLMKSTGTELYPVFLYSESPQETSALMVCSGLIASLYMPSDAIIRFRFSDKDIQRFLKGVFPDFRSEVELMSADMTEYAGDIEEDEDDDDDFSFDDDSFDFDDEDDESEDDEEYDFDDEDDEDDEDDVFSDDDFDDLDDDEENTDDDDDDDEE